MNEFLKAVTDVNNAINDFVWVKIGLFLLIGTGIIMTVVTKFFQVTHIGHWWKETIGGVFRKNSDSTKKIDKNQSRSFRHYAPHLPQPSERVILPVLPQQSA